MAALTAGMGLCLMGPLIGGQSEPDRARRQVHDFGTIAQGERVSHAFTLRNDGAAAMTIERVDLSEGSMAARFARVIAPGEEGHVRIEWDTSQVVGEVEGEGVVRFADPASGPSTLVLKGVVTPRIEFLPYPAVFASVFAGEGALRQVRIVNHEERPLAIRRVESDSSRFAATLDTLETGKVYELRVQVFAGLPPGRYEEALYLDTDDPIRSKIPIPVKILVKANVYANPEAVDFGTLSLAELAQSPRLIELLTQTVFIKSKGEFEIKALACELAFLRIRQSPEGKSGAFQIDVGLIQERLRPGPINGAIHVVTSDEKSPELLIPVRGELR